MDYNYKFKGVEYYSSLRSLAMQNRFEDEWMGRYNSLRQLRSKRYVGPNIAMFNKHNPSSCEDFFRRYISDYNEHDPYDKTCGRSLEQLWNVASEWKRRVEEKYPDSEEGIETYMDMIILHVIVETYIGGIAEQHIKGNILSKCSNCSILDFGPSFDSDYAIDIVVAEDKIIKKLIQVKPISTFTSRSKDTMSDVNDFSEKNRKGLDFLKNAGYIVNENLQVVYMMYDKYNEDCWYYHIVDEKQVFSFSLDELKNRTFVEQVKKQGSKKIWDEEKK